MNSARASLRFACAALAALLAACGGSPNTPNGPFVNSPGGTPPPPTPLVNVKLTVTIPASTHHNRMRPHYISSATQSLAVQLASVDGNGVTGVNASVVNTVPNAPHCKQQSGATVCTTTISGSPGTDVFSVTTYDALNATGSVLSVGTVSAHIGSGGGGLNISNQLSLDVNGNIAALQVSLSPNHAKRGNPVTSTVALKAFDAGGAQIVGRSAYAVPITLAVEGDGTGSFTLSAPGQSGQQLTIIEPTSNISLRYNGNKQAPSVTVQASVQQNNPVSAKSAFTLYGHIPPPPIGTIYALNLGSNNGQGATVTEYDNKDKGNAAPVRTLNLDSKLYARSIVVDAAGNLYVGYLDSPLGYSSSTGTPDQGNLVAIFAPGASGNTPPTALLTA
ncbi:MAG: hypothetical protein JOZ01_06005, partial [Candidatus Eremiobacteraeota bacterium]|nr:hypothetical protein [Candidatus Eremiobacteraeota bacterium]